MNKFLLEFSLNDAPYIIFDLELTGGNPSNNGVTEIFAVKVHQGKKIDEFYSLVNPGVLIPGMIQEMTGITNQMVKTAPKMEEVLPKFYEFCINSILVSHNSTGDIKFLQYIYENILKTKFNPLFFCTHILSEKLYAESPSKKLAGLASYLGIPSGTMHRAKEDALVTWQVFIKMLSALEQKAYLTVLDALRFQGDMLNMLQIGFAVPDQEIKSYPKTFGLFILKDSQNHFMMAISSHNLQSDMLKFSNLKAHPKSLNKLAVKVRSVEIIETNTLVEAMRLESEFYKKHHHAIKFTPWQWHHRSQELFGYYKTGDGSMKVLYEIPNAGMCEPMLVSEEPRGVIQKLIEKLNLIETKNGFLVKGVHIFELVRTFLSGEFKTKRFKLILQSLKMLLPYNAQKKEKLFEFLTALQTLDEFGIPTKFTLLSSQIGILFAIQNAKLTIAYPVIDGIIQPGLNTDGLKPDLFMRSLVGQKMVLALKKHKPGSSKRIFKPENLCYYNALAYFISQSQRKNSKFYFEHIL